jgi:hypothetical protein
LRRKFAAFGRTPRAVRIRRDIGTLIAGVSASAVMHKAQREVDVKGRVIATFDDYGNAWDAFNPGVSTFHSPQFGPGVIALVRALETLIEEERKVFEAARKIREESDDYRDAYERFDYAASATWSRLARISSQETVGVRLTAAKAAGVIECLNDNAPRSVPRRYRVRVSSDELARSGAVPVFPTPAEVLRLMNDPDAYERAKAAYIAAEESEGGLRPRPQPRTNLMFSSDLPCKCGFPLCRSRYVIQLRSGSLGEKMRILGGGGYGVSRVTEQGRI